LFLICQCPSDEADGKGYWTLELVNLLIKALSFAVAFMQRTYNIPLPLGFSPNNLLKNVIHVLWLKPKAKEIIAFNMLI
jgi:hypothetical protein